jgi:hypothetical protein
MDEFALAHHITFGSRRICPLRIASIALIS